MEEDDEHETRLAIVGSGSVALAVADIVLPEANGAQSKRPMILIQPPDDAGADGSSRAGTPLPGDMVRVMDFTSLAGPLGKMASNEEPIVGKISMPGISNIFGHANKARRIVWTVVVVAAISIATIQVKDRVQYYGSTPVTVNVRVTMNESLRFPVLTLCNKNGFNVSQMRHFRGVMIAEQVPAERTDGLYRQPHGWNVSRLVGYREMNIRQVWDALAHHPDRMIAECWFGRNKTCSQVGRWVPVYTYMGVCYSFVRNETSVLTTGMFNNLYVRVRETEDDMYMGESGWKLLVHDPLDSPVIDVRTHGSTLEMGWSRDVRLYLREFRTLNTWKRPCISDQNFSRCIEQCFVRAAASRMTCLLPFMNSTLVPELEYCSTPDSHWTNALIVERLLFHGEWTTNNCTHCRRQCKQDIYVTHTETMPMKSSGKTSKFRVFYQDFTFDEIEESADYGAVSLLCDIGGSLGFLLGFSVLTVFEIVDAVVQTVMMWFDRIAKKCRRSRRRRNSSVE